MNLQSRVIRIPLCTVHHWKQLSTLFGRHLAVNIRTVLPLLTRLNGSCTPPPPPPPPRPPLPPLSPDYFLSTTSSLFVFDLELQALLAMGVRCVRL